MIIPWLKAILNGRIGYGVFSYNESLLDAVYKCIQNQEDHKKQTFNDEYIDFLNKFEIGYDERYIFQDLV